MLKFYAFFNDLIINNKIDIFLEVRSLCKYPGTLHVAGVWPVVAV